MRLSAIRGTALTVGLLLLFPATAWSQRQQQWEPEVWLGLVQEGDELCEEALSLEEGGDEAEYRQLMFGCLRAKEAALEMLRGAVLRNQVEHLDELWPDANRDLFNLTENVIVLYILLDQCIAAGTILNRALRDPDILPEGGLAHLESLGPEISECNDRVASSEGAPVFDEERYETLIQVAESWRSQAYNRPDDDDEGRSANLYEASQNYGEALGMLRDAVVEGLIDDPGDRAELFDLYDQIITVTLEMNLCSGAQRRIRQAETDASELPDGDPARFQARLPEIQECQQRIIAANRPEPEPVEEDEAPQLREQAEVGVAPYVLWGVAGASAIAAVVLNVTGSSDRDELDRVRAECNMPEGVCDREREEQLGNDVNTRKVTVAVLSGVAIVTAVVGTVLFFTQGSDEAPSPEPDPVEAGVPIFSWDGLGGSVRIHF